MEVKVFCPHCSQEYTIDDWREGAQVECAKCRKVFKLSKAVTQKQQSAKSALNPQKRKTPILATINYFLAFIFILSGVAIGVANQGNSSAIGLVVNSILFGFLFASIGYIIASLARLEDKVGK